MTRALFFGVFALLSAVVFAVPTADQEQISIGDIVNALGLGFVKSININITVSMIHPKNHIDCRLTTDLQQLPSLVTNLIEYVWLFVVDLAAHLGEYLLSVNVTSKSCLDDAISLLREGKYQYRTPFPSN